MIPKHGSLHSRMQSCLLNTGGVTLVPAHLYEYLLVYGRVIDRRHVTLCLAVVTCNGGGGFMVCSTDHCGLRKVGSQGRL